MQKVFEQFESNINSVREIEYLYRHLVTELKLPNDLSDLLRSQLVYAVSALDKLIHELVRVGMLQSFSGKRARTEKFSQFSISLETYQKIQQTLQQAQTNQIPQLVTPEHFFEQEIINKHKHLAFQHPDKITDALSLIWAEKQKWHMIASKLQKTEPEVKTTLKLIVSRRNQIVHEYDMDIQTNLRNDIDSKDVKEVVEFVFALGQTIFLSVNF